MPSDYCKRMSLTREIANEVILFKAAIFRGVSVSRGKRHLVYLSPGGYIWGSLLALVARIQGQMGYGGIDNIYSGGRKCSL